jgi:hypothetical protein
MQDEMNYEKRRITKGIGREWRNKGGVREFRRWKGRGIWYLTK